MNRFTLCILLVASIAFGQVTVVVPAPAAAHKVELEPLPDGGVRLTAYARTESVQGVVIDRGVTCESGELTAAQRTALATIRTAALACWRSKAVDGGI